MYLPQQKQNKTLPIIGVAFLITVLFYLAFILLLSLVNGFFMNHYLKFNSVIQIKFNWPVEIKKRVLKAPRAVSVVRAEEIPTPTPLVLTDRVIAEYIKTKPWPYSIAIRLAKSENFWNKTHSFDCRREGGLNSDGTRDHGLWQINDIHIRSGAITLEDTLDCFKATDFAYRLYVGRGNNFSAWSAFNNGSYLNHTETWN